ncbi:MAG TPA: uridine kinase [Firmicutes bacterium]|jgi:uridine kinase|nr:uridine kinase [Bacillota bacterium]
MEDMVKSKHRDYFELCRQIATLLISQARVLLAIDGNSGAGKTSLAFLLKEVYDANIFHMDHFFLRPELKTAERLQEIGGNVDYLRFKQEVIYGLQSGGKFQYQRYDCVQQALVEYIAVEQKAVNIIEGVYSLHPSLINYYDLKVFLSVGAKEQSRRILRRNGPDLHQRFLREWIPMENRYFQEMKIQERCDFVFRSNEILF